MNNFFRVSDHLYMAYGVWAVAGLMVLFAGTEMTGAVKDLMRQSKGLSSRSFVLMSSISFSSSQYWSENIGSSLCCCNNLRDAVFISSSSFNCFF